VNGPFVLIETREMRAFSFLDDPSVCLKRLRKTDIATLVQVSKEEVTG